MFESKENSKRGKCFKKAAEFPPSSARFYTGYGLPMDEGFRMQMPLFIQPPHPKEATP
jgi:hypothetical protein